MTQNRMRFGLAAILALVPSGALAQPPGGGQMPPEIAAKIKAWQKWRDNNKNLSNLQTLLYQVRELDKKPDTQLDKKQAGDLLGIVKTWRTKPSKSKPRNVKPNPTLKPHRRVRKPCKTRLPTSVRRGRTRKQRRAKSRKH